MLNQQQGFLAWDPEKLARRPQADPGPEYPRLSPPTPLAPRLFISYAWARDEEGIDDYEFDQWVDAFAGWLFGRGYEFVFDRDPRNFDKLRSALHLLIRMNDCNYFVPVVSEHYAARVDPNSPQHGGWAANEWRHATKAAEAGFLTFLGVWHSGSVLPPPLTPENTIDIRKDPSPWAKALATAFPAARDGHPAVPTLRTPDRPPDPPHWPAYRPY
jgi:hypothetical protein